MLPLPAASTDSWPYGDHIDLDVLADRDTYRSRLAPQRAGKLAVMISQHRPAFVVVLGATYRPYWEQAAGRTLPTDSEPPVVTETGTRMIVARHPAAYGVTNAEFHDLGRALAANGRGTREPAGLPSRNC